MQVVGLSDIGLIRKRNEDSYFINEENGIFIVCDGMGGHKGGDIASSMAIQTIVTELNKYSDITLELLNKVIKKANYNIWLEGHSNPDLYEMGTTIILAKITDMHLKLCHVGDSRAYLIRENEIIRLTNDHTLAAQMAENGVINNDKKSYNHILTRALGISEDIEIDNISHELYENDIILLCSDGLTDMLSDIEIMTIITDNISELQVISQNLIKEAVKNGGSDNITLILIQISGR